MAFRIRGTGGPCPESPEELFHDLRKRTIPGLLAHQADVMRDYVRVHAEHSDMALQLPTGSGKTLVGLLIGEWRRRKFAERVVYLCPTKQLVHQVADQAKTKYGIELHAFVGSRADYDQAAKAEWQNAEAIAVTNYSSLFNTNPFFADPHVIVLDDAHSAENYISAFWSLTIEEADHPAAFAALRNLVVPRLSPADQGRLVSLQESDRFWVDKVPTPVLSGIAADVVSLLDTYVEGTDLRYAWQVLRHRLHACHMYLSSGTILIRPLVPPTNTHRPFAGARQRIYMSATLGAGGDLERITGRPAIHRIQVPAGWDKQGIGRRFFVMPERTLDEAETEAFVAKAMKLAGRSLYLVPDGITAERITSFVRGAVACPTFDARQIEASKQPFVVEPQAVAIVANRYDGIDLVDDECRLVFADGLPRGANLQERFLSERVGAGLLLDDRVLTRVVQGFGRCTRSPNDYAAVVILGDRLNQYLLRRERRQFFHPEVQAELEFGLDQSKDATRDSLAENLRHFLAQDDEWEVADAAIVSLRATLRQQILPGTEELRAAVGFELAYQYSLWERDYVGALEHCRAVLAKLVHDGLRGYRALWLYLAGSSAWLAHEASQMTGDSVAREYFAEARRAATGLTWLVDLERVGLGAPEDSGDGDDKAVVLAERIEDVFEECGTLHNRKYDKEESAILRKILQDDDGIEFEKGHVGLGRFLGYDAGRSDQDGAPDCWWIVDRELAFVFEDNAEAKPTSVLGANKARQAMSHPAWLREKLDLPENTTIIPVLITPCTKCHDGAAPHLKTVRYWQLSDFRNWATEALRVIRDLRKRYPERGDMFWRSEAAAQLRAAAAAPMELSGILARSASDVMEIEG